MGWVTRSTSVVSIRTVSPKLCAICPSPSPPTTPSWSRLTFPGLYALILLFLHSVIRNESSDCVCMRMRKSALSIHGGIEVTWLFVLLRNAGVVRSHRLAFVLDSNSGWALVYSLSFGGPPSSSACYEACIDDSPTCVFWGVCNYALLLHVTLMISSIRSLCLSSIKMSKSCLLSQKQNISMTITLFSRFSKQPCWYSKTRHSVTLYCSHPKFITLGFPDIFVFP